MPPKAPRNINHDKGLTLLTLGEMALVREGDSPPLLGPGKPTALLAYLALAPGRTASREHLVELLWADADPERARHALRQVLWQLRQLLGDGAFDGKDEITLIAPIDTDRDRFLALIEAGDLEQAAAAYTGPFLPAFASAGGAAFEHWADTERDRLQTAFLRTVERLVRRHLAAGSPRPALAAARRLLEIGHEPLVGRRLMIEAYLALGDGISAAAEADALERWAVDEEWVLDTPTRGVIERTRASLRSAEAGAAPTGGARLVAELVGREREFATILDAWAAAKDGKPRHKHVVAPAGLGKTRLLRELESRIRHTGGAVRYVRAHPGDRDLPFALACELAGALASLTGARGVAPEVAATLIGLDPSLANTFNGTADQATGDEARRRRAFALTELLRATCEEGALALLVDDLHWADAESFVILESMLARADNARLLVVSATRPVAERQLRSERRKTLQLAPLTIAQIGELLDSVAAHDPDEVISGWPALLFEAAGGNPLLTLELIQLAQERGLVAIVDGVWRCADEPALRTLMGSGQGIRQRLGRLGPESRELMLLLALSGAPLHRDLLAEATSTDKPLLGQRLDLLERQGMAQRAGESWEPAHDEIAAAALELFADDVRAVRTRLAAALEAGGGGLAELARTASHYAVLSDTAALTRLAVRRMQLVRQNGAPETPDVAVRQLLGGHCSVELQAAVRRAIPLGQRLQPGLPFALAAAGVLLVAGIAATQRPASAPPDATFEVSWYDASGELESGVVDVRRAGWDPSEPLEVIAAPRPLLRHLVDPSPTVALRYSPSGDSAVTLMRRPGTSNEEVVLLTRDSLVWLTTDERDDVAPRFLPDGSGIVFLTTRWSPQGGDDTDVARLDFATGTVTRLTDGPDRDGAPAISPDGTRLAFVRRHRDGSPGALCVMTWGGSLPICRPPSNYPADDLLDWIDLNTVLIQADSLGESIQLRIDTRTWESASIAATAASSVIDPKSEIGACLCESPADRRIRLFIGPVGDMRAQRPVTVPEGREARRVSLVRAGGATITLDRVQIAPIADLSAGSRYQPTVAGWNRLGERVAFDTTTIRWLVADSSIARVDSTTGLLMTLRPGETTLHVSAGGWRVDSTTLRVSPSNAQQLLREEWQLGWEARWRVFGEPPARVGPHRALGVAMHNNGDGRHLSGVYSSLRLSRTGDFTMEALVSTPISETMWQRLIFHISSVGDSAKLKPWDHGGGDIPGSGIVAPATCFLAYPANEGEGQDRLLSLIVGGRPTRAVAPAVMRSGRPYRLRLTLFADGHCGVAVDGQPLAISVNSIRPDSLIRIWLAGNSVLTDIAVGPVTIWAGDPGGVDWGRVRR